MKKKEIEAIKEYVQQVITLTMLIHLSDEHHGVWPASRFDLYEKLSGELDNLAEDK